MKKNVGLFIAFFSSHVFATPVNINHADAKTIANSLIGISLKKAEAIVADRSKNGAFNSIYDLKRVIGIGEKTIAVNQADILFIDNTTTILVAPLREITPPISSSINIIPPAPSEQPLNQMTKNTQIGWLVGILIVLIGLFSLIIGKYFPQKLKIK